MIPKCFSAVYRRFLRLLPDEFRSKHASEMEEAFRESLALYRRRSGLPGELAALAHSLGDVSSLAVRLRRREARPRRQRDERRRDPLSGLAGDLRIAGRRLRRTPSYAIASVVTLSLGIGATVLMLSVVDAVLLRPLPYRDSDRLVALFLNEENHDAPRAPTSPVNFLAWRADSRTLVAMTAAHPWAPSLTGRDRPDELHGLKVTPSLFELLGIRPRLGRTFVEGDEPSTLVLGYDLWQRRFGGDPGIVGQSLLLDGKPHEVVGVMPPEFHFPPFWATEAEMWSPLVFTPDEAARHSRYLRVFARLADGASFHEARSEMETIGTRLVAAYPDRNAATSITIEPLLEPVVATSRSALLLLLVAVVLLTLIACANVANLQLVRSSARAREIALETALGAGRGRRLRQQLAESLYLAVASGVLGALVAAWGVYILRGLAPSGLPRLGEIGVDGNLLLFAILVSTGVALGLGIVTTPRTDRRGIGAALRESSARSTSQGAKRLRDLLVVSQVASSVVLLVGAGLVVRSFLELRNVDPGFRRDRLLTSSVLLAGSRHTEPSRQSLLFRQIRETVRQLPGVDSVALINNLPIGGDIWGLSFELEGAEVTDSGDRPRASQRTATPDYFRTMAVPLLAGRDFLESDDENGAPVVIVNRTLAERYASLDGILGRRLDLGRPGDEDLRTVVGVVGDSRQWDLTQDVLPEIYFPYSQNPASSYLTATLVVASRRPPEEIQPAVERAVWSVAGEIPIVNVRTMERILSEHVAPRRFTSLLFATFAGLALLLAAVGLYGVLSYTVTQQTVELGIRAALGASRAHLGKLVFARGALLVGSGFVVGLGVAFMGARVLSGLLFGIGPNDPWTFATVPLFLASVAALAIYLPARRAARLDPLRALRSE